MIVILNFCSGSAWVGSKKCDPRSTPVKRGPSQWSLPSFHFLFPSFHPIPIPSLLLSLLAIHHSLFFLIPSSINPFPPVLSFPSFLVFLLHTCHEASQIHLGTEELCNHSKRDPGRSRGTPAFSMVFWTKETCLVFVADGSHGHGFTDCLPQPLQFWFSRNEIG